MSRPLQQGRLLAGGIAVCAVAAVVAQHQLAADVPNRPTGMAAWWWLAGYFTILTNLAVALVMARAALSRAIPARLAGATVLSIAVVGIIYHLLLANLWAPQGLAWWADQALHSAVPLLTLGWWQGFADKRLSWTDLPALIAWPTVYAAYALTRGALTGFWPYPFLDAGHLGWATVGGNAVGLLALFAGLGAGLIAFARRSVG